MELERFETLERLQAISAAYKQVESWCARRADPFERIDAGGTPEEIHQRIQQRVSRLWAGD